MELVDKPRKQTTLSSAPSQPRKTLAWGRPFAGGSPFKSPATPGYVDGSGVVSTSKRGTFTPLVRPGGKANPVRVGDSTPRKSLLGE